MQVIPHVPVGETFSPATGDHLLHGKLHKKTGPAPPQTTAVEPHLVAVTDLFQLTNGDFLSLMWSGRKVEALGGAKFGDSHLQKHYDIMHVWLLTFTTVGNRTPHAILAKCQRLEKKYLAALKKYTRRPTLANHSHLYKFLSTLLLHWGAAADDIPDAAVDINLTLTPSPLPDTTINTSPHKATATQPSPQIVLRQGKTLLRRTSKLQQR